MCSHSDGDNLRLCFYMHYGLKDSVGLVHFITENPYSDASIHRSLLLAWL